MKIKRPLHTPLEIRGLEYEPLIKSTLELLFHNFALNLGFIAMNENQKYL